MNLRELDISKNRVFVFGIYTILETRNRSFKWPQICFV